MALQLKSVPASSGSRWVGDALRLFFRKPLVFTGLFAMFVFGSTLVSQLLPFVGGLLFMMTPPLLSLGFMIAGQSALLSGPVNPRQFLEPLLTDPKRRRALLLLCAGYGISFLALSLVALQVADESLGKFAELQKRGNVSMQEVQTLLNAPDTSLALLILSTLGAALAVPYWHAPALVHWGGQTAAQALFSSTLAVWRNRGAFFVYLMTLVGVAIALSLLVTVLLSALGSMQFAVPVVLLMWAVFGALFYLSVLFTFNDSFGGKAVPPMDDDYTRPDPG